ncbi:MAG: hypothetical protein IBV52_09560 [Candidatus Bathyarchaeota archaeon]
MRETWPQFEKKIIAIACSTLLGKNNEEREEIKDYLSRAYSMRNCIVHGSDISETNPFELVEEISERRDFVNTSLKELQTLSYSSNDRQIIVFM